MKVLFYNDDINLSNVINYEVKELPELEVGIIIGSKKYKNSDVIRIFEIPDNTPITKTKFIVPKEHASNVEYVFKILN